jgi:hypothetical protein
MNGKTVKEGNGGWFWKLPEQDAQNPTLSL